MLCNVFVLPTTAEKGGEGWGVVVNEAMSCSKPVIVSNAAGSAYQLVKEGVNGFMVQESDSEALAYAIEKIISNDETEKKMGLESKKIIDDKFFTLENKIKIFSDAINFALNNKK